MKELRAYGPPGTGKTTWLSRQIARAVEKYGPDKVVVASFTRAAARELISRDLPVDEQQVGTLHALAWRALGRPTIAETKAKEWNERGLMPISGKHDSSMDDLDAPRGEQEGDRLLAQVNTLRARLLPEDGWPMEARAFWADWSQWKLETGYYDFTDIIEKSMILHPYAPGAPVVGFFDEVQDFTALELRLVRMWISHMEYGVLVGDDDQSLYLFKGATPEAFLLPALPPDQVRVLDQSYRVPKAVHDYADRWIRQVKLRKEKEWKPRDFEGSVNVDPDLNYRDPDALTERVRAATAGGRSVLVVGTCSYMLQPFLKALRASGEPFYNPYRPDRPDWNPFKLPRQGSVATWQAVQAYTRPTWTVGDVARFHRLFKRAAFRKEGLAMLAALPDETVIGEELAGQVFADPDTFVTNGEQYLLASKSAAMDFPMAVAQRHGAEALGKRPSVMVGTVHSVKGGQADHVFLLPDISMAGMATLHEDPDPVTRTMYVGMTRARESLTLCGPSSPMAVEWDVR